MRRLATPLSTRRRPRQDTRKNDNPTRGAPHHGAEPLLFLWVCAAATPHGGRRMKSGGVGDACRTPWCWRRKCGRAEGTSQPSMRRKTGAEAPKGRRHGVPPEQGAGRLSAKERRPQDALPGGWAARRPVREALRSGCKTGGRGTAGIKKMAGTRLRMPATLYNRNLYFTISFRTMFTPSPLMRTK